MERITEYNDLLVLSVALRAGHPLASFDKTLRSRAEDLDLGVFPKY